MVFRAKRALVARNDVLAARASGEW